MVDWVNIGHPERLTYLIMPFHEIWAKTFVYLVGLGCVVKVRESQRIFEFKSYWVCLGQVGFHGALM